MPYIATTTNVSISGRKKETIKERMGAWARPSS